MKDMFKLDGKIAVVIGGAGGIGEACALASRGARLVVAGRTLSKLEEVSKKINSETESGCLALQVDVTSEESVEKLAATVVEKLKTVDILVTAHGINLKVPALEIPVDGWDSIFATNARGNAGM
jgi:NAD(P)-dependent dehydrogenase (short-subunit alcohol dehydrogenase family)